MFKYLNVPTVQGLSRSLPNLGKLYNLNPNTPNTRDEMEIKCPQQSDFSSLTADLWAPAISYLEANK